MKLIFIFLLSLTTSFKLFDSPEKTAKRLEIINLFAEEFTSGKLFFELDKEKGIIPKTTQAISKTDNVIEVPIDYIQCGFDMFPLKLEIGTVIFDSLKKEFNEREILAQEKVGKYVFAYYLMFLQYHNKEDVYKRFATLGKYEYAERIPESKARYLEAYSNTILSSEMWENEEYMLFQLVGQSLEFESSSLRVFTAVKEFVDDFAEIKSVVSPWTSDFGQFKHALSIIQNFSQPISKVDYERMIGRKIKDYNMGSFHDNFIKQFIFGQEWSYLVPLSELLFNYQVTANNYSRPDRIFRITKGTVKLNLPYNFKEDESYLYTLSETHDNKSLARRYGFFTKEATYLYKYPLVREMYPEEKNKVCLKHLGCYIYDISKAYEIKSEQIDIPLPLNSAKFDFSVLGAFRIYVIENNHFIEYSKHYIETIRKYGGIDQTNELYARALYHEAMNGISKNNILIRGVIE